MSKFDKVDKAYKKALKVVDSCETQEHIKAALRYVYLFDDMVERLFKTNISSSQKQKNNRLTVQKLQHVLDYRLAAKLMNIKEQI